MNAALSSTNGRHRIMMLLDHHWINKGCTVEILYGEHRSFNGIIKEFKVVAMDLSKPQTVQGFNHFIVDIYGEHLSIPQTSLGLLKKPCYTRIKAGLWKPDHLLT